MAALIETIHIHTISRFEIFKLLESCSLDKKPYFVQIEVFKSEEEKVLKYIEQYLIGIKSSQFPYAMYVESKTNFKTDYFTLVNNINDCPLFYRKKTKLLSVKEQKIQDRIDLKLRKLINLGINEKKQLIESYANFHKKLYQLCDEGKKLENVLEIIEKTS